MKLAFFELETWQREKVRDIFTGHELVFCDQGLDASTVDDYNDIEVAVVFIYSQVTKEVLDKMPNVKCVATMSTGFDHVDVKEAQKRGIIVCNVPSYGENTVAEFAFSLYLTVARKIFPSIDQTKEHHLFETDVKLRGNDVAGKTLGLVGSGRIGKHMVRMAKGFDMRVLVYDVFPNPELAEKLGFQYVSKEELYAQSDVISVHVPYNKHTHHLIDEHAVNQMKQGVIIINTARGGIIDTAALVRGLKMGKIGGAGLDVLEGEYAIKGEMGSVFSDDADFKVMFQNHLLMKMENVVVTPHNAFNSWEALERILQTTINNVHSFIVGTAENVVKVE